MGKKLTKASNTKLLLKLEELQMRLNEAEETITAIRNGDVDAIIVSGQAGEKVFSLTSAETPYRIILEEMSEGAVITKSDGSILYFNQRFTDLMTTTSVPALGLNILEFVSKDEKPKLLDLLKTGLSRRSSCIIPFLNRLGETKYLNFSVKPLPAQLDRNICIIISDMTKIHLYQNHLNELVTEGTLEIEKVNKQLRELITIKNKFFSIIAHDLSNQFTSLIGASELLSENISSFNSEQLKALSTVLKDSSKSGYTILQNLLDWSRSQTGQLKIVPEKINLRKTIDEQIKNVLSVSTKKEIEIHSKVPFDKYLYTDQNILNTILRNLINNALKFTPRNGEVIINTYEDNSYQLISVKDTGVGISKENIENLFKLDSPHTNLGTENEQGSGLGLKICKEFVEKLNGNISVKSTENIGSEFIVSIPIIKS